MILMCCAVVCDKIELKRPDVDAVGYLLLTQRGFMAM